MSDPQTEAERLLAEGPRQAPEPEFAEPSSGRDKGKGKRSRRSLLHSAVLLALLVSFHFLAHFPWWVAWPLRLTAIWLGVTAVVRSRRSMHWRRLPRLLFLVWLAVSLLTLVLAAIDRFQRSDLVLLTVVFAILAATWLASRPAYEL